MTQFQSITSKQSLLGLQRMFLPHKQERDKRKASSLPLPPSCFEFGHDSWSYGNLFVTNRQKAQGQKHPPRMADQSNEKVHDNTGK